ncbi:hypothetical protein SH1V18_32740 [Vallitalea longa]|uniref:Uncharacterized protein n=1 Tax=Vallitalea longa TaxID=2936439 RepID=A0A9W5YCZ4_9FIRM|nr:hypothetical protein [Vallitalea longa]GKX30794.1 hypothetical protein SH1V18_32740 [Vallitalea longa]
MKLNKILVYVIMILVLITSCKKDIVAGEVQDTEKKIECEEVEETPKEIVIDIDDIYNSVDIDIGYVELENLNEDNVPEIDLEYYPKDGDFILKKVSDGYICVSLEEYEDENALEDYLSPMVYRFNENGKLSWKKHYDYKTHVGKIGQVLTFDDDSFIFHIDSYQDWNEGRLINDNCYLIKCNKDGEEEWTKEYSNSNRDMLANILLSDSEEILIIGEWKAKDGKEYDDIDKGLKEELNNDIVITKLDAEGNMIEQKSFGGSNDEHVDIVGYDKKLGIIIEAISFSNDGPFAVDIIDKWNNDFIACIDEKNLEIKWIYRLVGGKYTTNNRFSINNGMVYMIVTQNNRNRQHSQSLITIDDKGNASKLITQTYDQMVDKFNSLMILQNGDIVIGEGNQYISSLRIFDDTGKVKKVIHDINLVPDEIIPTDDGGFIVKSRRQIKTVPQPIYVSCIWYDTELVMMKYDSNYNIEWRKTYDRYKNNPYWDCVIPLNNGKQITEIKTDYRKSCID